MILNTTKGALAFPYCTAVRLKELGDNRFAIEMACAAEVLPAEVLRISELVPHLMPLTDQTRKRLIALVRVENERPTAGRTRRRGATG